jgi:hypothetical protein
MRTILFFSLVMGLATGCNPASSASSASKTEIRVRAPGVTVDVEKKKD